MPRNYETTLAATFRGKTAGVLKFFWTQAVLSELGQEVAKSSMIPAGTILFNNSTTAPLNCIPYIAGASIDFNTYPDLKTVYPTGKIPGNTANDYLRVSANSTDWRKTGNTYGDTIRNFTGWFRCKFNTQDSGGGILFNGSNWGAAGRKGNTREGTYNFDVSRGTPTSQEIRPVTTFVNAWIYAGTVNKSSGLDATKFFTEDHTFDAWSWDPDHKIARKETYRAVRGMGFSDKFYTRTAPPETKEGESASWTGSEWEVKANFIGKTIYNTKEVGFDVVTKLGDLPEGWTDKPYPIVEDGFSLVWNGKDWGKFPPTDHYKAWRLFNAVRDNAEDILMTGKVLSDAAKAYLAYLLPIAYPNGSSGDVQPKMILAANPGYQDGLKDHGLGDYSNPQSKWYM